MRNQKTSINPKYTFESFLSCKNNKQVVDFCLFLIKNLKRSSNFLHITGGSAVGKTHILQAIGNRVLDIQPGSGVRYYTSMQFLEEFVHHLSARTLSDFYCDLAWIDVLLVDDVQNFAGKNATLQELSSLLYKLRDSNILFVSASEKGPDELEGFEDHFAGRVDFTTLQLRSPDNAIRKSILSKFAHENGIDLPEDVIKFMAGMNSDVRCLTGHLKRLMAESELSGGKITLSMCKRSLAFS